MSSLPVWVPGPISFWAVSLPGPMFFPGGTDTPLSQWQPLKRAVRILLECILVNATEIDRSLSIFSAVGH